MYMAANKTDAPNAISPAHDGAPDTNGQDPDLSKQPPPLEQTTAVKSPGQVTNEKDEEITSPTSPTTKVKKPAAAPGSHSALFGLGSGKVSSPDDEAKKSYTANQKPSVAMPKNEAKPSTSAAPRISQQSTTEPRAVPNAIPASNAPSAAAPQDPVKAASPPPATSITAAELDKMKTPVRKEEEKGMVDFSGEHRGGAAVAAARGREGTVSGMSGVSSSSASASFYSLVTSAQPQSQAPVQMYAQAPAGTSNVHQSRDSSVSRDLAEDYGWLAEHI